MSWFMRNFSGDWALWELGMKAIVMLRRGYVLRNFF